MVLESQPAVEEPIGIAEKMQRLKEKMGFNKPVGSIPLSEVYAEPKPVNQTEAVEFKAWYELVKAAGLVEYSYRDARCFAVVVLASGEALAWRDARDLLGLHPLTLIL